MGECIFESYKCKSFQDPKAGPRLCFTLSAKSREKFLTPPRPDPGSATEGHPKSTKGKSCPPLEQYYDLSSKHRKNSHHDLKDHKSVSLNNYKKCISSQLRHLTRKGSLYNYTVDIITKAKCRQERQKGLDESSRQVLNKETCKVTNWTLLMSPHKEIYHFPSEV